MKNMTKELSMNKLVIVYFFILVLLQSCSSLKFVTETEAIIETPQLAISTQSVQNKVISVPTATGITVSSRTPTFAATSTPTPAPTLTWTAIPTLNILERDQQLRELMKTNGNCSLPCFWGIEPKEDSWPDFKRLLNRLDLQIQDNLVQTVRETRIYDEEFALEEPYFQGSLSFFVDADNKVKIFGFSGNDLLQAQYYSIKSVMGDLGVPTYVGIDLRLGGQKGIPNEVSTTVFIAYDEAPTEYWLGKPWGLFYYTGAAHKFGSRYRFCPDSMGVADPAWPPDSFTFTMQPSQSVMNTDELAEVTGRTFMPFFPDFESATGVSVKEFYKTIIENDEVVCFDTPIDYWQLD
jgi:hypothetical protein